MELEKKLLANMALRQWDRKSLQEFAICLQMAIGVCLHAEGSTDGAVLFDAWNKADELSDLLGPGNS